MIHPDGLVFHPSEYDPPLGHPGFDVYLGGSPQRRYFDARRAHFPVEQSGALRRMLVEHPFLSGKEFTFIPGRIRLEAFDGDLIEVMTFGGHAVVSNEGEETVCRVTSTAPLIPLSEAYESPFVMLEGELEVVLAQSRANWGKDEGRHLDRISDLDPMAFFVASIHTLEERLGRLARVDEDPAALQALHLARDIHFLLERSGRWPQIVPRLDELLE